jgi:hypothetical protein
MVLTRRSPEKTPPAGIPTRRRRDLSRRGQQQASAEQGERRQRLQQESVAAVGATKEPAPTPPPLLTQPPPPSTSTQSHRSSKSAIAAAAAIEFASTLKFADAEVEEQEDVEVAAVGGVHRSDDVNDDDDSGDEEWVRREMVPGGKTTGETDGDQEPEENNEDDDELTITRLDVKSKSKMSDADLCQYFISKLQKKEASDCGNRDCHCLKILSNGQVRLAVSRYLSWFWRRPLKYERDIILFEWYNYSSFVKKVGQRSLRFHNYRLPCIDDGTEPVPETVRNHLICTKGLQMILGYGRKSFVRMSREAMCSSVLPPHKATGKINYNAIENDQATAF